MSKQNVYCDTVRVVQVSVLINKWKLFNQNDIFSIIMKSHVRCLSYQNLSTLKSMSLSTEIFSENGNESVCMKVVVHLQEAVTEAGKKFVEIVCTSIPYNYLL